jgi:hypothetical protein
MMLASFSHYHRDTVLKVVSTAYRAGNSMLPHLVKPSLIRGRSSRRFDTDNLLRRLLAECKGEPYLTLPHVNRHLRAAFTRISPGPRHSVDVDLALRIARSRLQTLRKISTHQQRYEWRWQTRQSFFGYFSASRCSALSKLKHLLPPNESSGILQTRNAESIAGCDALANAKL